MTTNIMTNTFLTKISEHISKYPSNISLSADADEFENFGDFLNVFEIKIDKLSTQY